MRDARNRSLKDYGRFVEASIALLLARLVVALAPFRAIAGLASWHGNRLPPTGDAGELGSSIALAITRASQRLPMRCVCIHEGLAAQLMLRRRGMPTFFHYGIRPAGDRLTAHVWVTLNDVILIGEAEAGCHASVATFPEAAS